MKISIITATYNSGKTLEETILSVLSQNHQDFEHIIVDGASKDNTIEIVKKYEKKYEGKLKYISEPDKGIYDAMNKGIKLATGDIIGFLNSDDKYANNKVLKTISETIEKTNCDGTHGNLLYMDEETMTKPQRKWITKSTNIKTGNITAHPTLYLKKEVYDKLGLYDLKYKVVADYNFMVKLLLNKDINLVHINEYLIHMRLGGVSSNGIKGYIYNLKESYIALKDNNIKFAAIISFIRIIKIVWQMVTAKFVKIKDEQQTDSPQNTIKA